MSSALVVAPPEVDAHALAVGEVVMPPNTRLKLATRGGQGRLPFVISKVARRSLSAIR